MIFYIQSIFLLFVFLTVKISYDHKSNMCERVQGTNCVIVFDTWCYPRFYKLAKISRLIYLIYIIARTIFK